MNGAVWRLTGFELRDALLHLSRIVVCTEAGEPISGAVVACTHLPTAGDVASLASGGSAAWSADIVAHPGFAIIVTLPSAMPVGGVRIAGPLEQHYPVFFEFGAYSGGRLLSGRVHPVFEGADVLNEYSAVLFGLAAGAWELVDPAGSGADGYSQGVLSETGQHMLVVARGSGVSVARISHDWGATFTTVSTGSAGSTGYLSCAISDDGQVMVVVGRGSSPTLRISRNGGATWSALPGPISGINGFSLMGMSGDGRVMLIGQRGATTSRAYLSTDAGVSWSLTGPEAGVADGYLTASVSGDGNLLLLGCVGLGAVVRISRDAGLTWSSPVIPGGTTGVGRSAISHDGGTVVVTSSEASSGGVWLSRDSGVTFNALHSQGLLASGRFDSAAVSASGGTIVVCNAGSSSSVTWLSIDFGHSFQPVAVNDFGSSGVVNAGLSADGRVALACGFGSSTSQVKRFVFAPTVMRALRMPMHRPLLAAQAATLAQGYGLHGVIPLFSLDSECGGVGVIYGTVELYAQAGNIPLPRRVRLHRSRDGLLVRETWSNAQGEYRFDDITDRYKYDVIAWDHEGLQQSVVANELTPEVMP